MINLKEINRSNYMTCIKLKLTKEQQGFVASNTFSLAQSKYHPECTPYGIFFDDTMVGFLMHCIDEEDDNHWIWRLMIDASYQGNGYAYQAMRIIINDIKKDNSRDRILISFAPGNIVAERLYKKLGFKHTGQYVDKERIMELQY